MIIRLTRIYQNSAGAYIKPGEYDINAKALQGLGQYLVNIGIAEVVTPIVDDNTNALDVEETLETMLIETMLNGMTDDALVDYADENGIDLGRLTKRESIIARILENV